MSVQETTWATGSSYQQQASMVRFLAEELGATVRYLSEGDKDERSCVAIVVLPSGAEYRFNVYGTKI